MTRVTTTRAREDFANVLRRVNKDGERILLHDHGKNIAALVSVEDLSLLEELEDRRDAAEAERRLNDPAETPIPYETAQERLGLR